MATLREYFDMDMKCLSVHTDWQIQNRDGSKLASVTAKIGQDFEANAKFWSFFVPGGAEVDEYVLSILSCRETNRCVLTPEGDPAYVEMGLADYSERMNSSTLLFTKRVFLYIDSLLEPSRRGAVAELGAQHGFHVIVRDREYATKRSQIEKPLAFICYDSRDKDSLVRELVLQLSKLMCPVWYDEYSLKVGDSLRSCIERGLKETKKCIVVLSPNFLSNEGWGKAEFDSVYTREIIEKHNVILPVWHNVTAHDVYNYSPRLADKVGLDSSIGIEELARRLANAIKERGT